MRIHVIAGRYAISGVPLAQIRLARALASAGHSVELTFGLVNPGYTISAVEGVRVRVMDRPRVIGMLMPLVRMFRRDEPDIVFSAGDHLNAVVLLAAVLSRTRAKISCSSRVTPFDTYSNIPLTKRWVLKQVMRAVMPRADALTCVSNDMVEQYRRVFDSPRHICVYNIIDDDQSRRMMEEPVDEDWLQDHNEPVLVAAGSLVPWKGFSVLIAAMAELLKSRRARLVILGDGPLRNELTDQIAALGLRNHVRLFGYVDNPLKYFSRSDVFVLSSYVEGMPNVLVEAMMCGCTPVSTNCPTGPREVLQEGKFGYLVPVGDPGAMAAALVSAIDHRIPDSRLREAVAPFSAPQVLSRHFQVLGLSLRS